MLRVPAHNEDCYQKTRFYGNRRSNPKFGEPAYTRNSASDEGLPVFRAILASESPMTGEIRTVRQVDRLSEFRVGVPGLTPKKIHTRFFSEFCTVLY